MLVARARIFAMIRRNVTGEWIQANLLILLRTSNLLVNIPFVDLRAQYNIEREIDAAIFDVINHSAFIRGPHVDRSRKPGPRLWE